MNNKTKGWIAAGLGGALLLGTGGTFALWQDTAELTGTINAGELRFPEENLTVSWDDVDDPIVPNQSVTGSVEIEPTLVGSALVASLSVDADDFDLSDYFTTIEWSGDGVLWDEASDFSIDGLTEDDSATTLYVRVTADNWTLVQNQGEDLDLGSFTVVLDQTAPTP